MSRIGKAPIAVPSGVTMTLKDGNVEIKGPKGVLSRPLLEGLKVENKDSNIIVTRNSESKQDKSFHGLMRVLISNMVTGVTTGFQKSLVIEGVGYRAALKGKDIDLTLGYSHPIHYKAPEGITFEVAKPTQILVKGIDKEQVGQVAVKIRSFRKPEPYKGKGIRYEGEQIRRKVGKTGAK